MPYTRASVLSVLTFWWVNPLIMLGYKKPLTELDLWTLDPNDSTKYNSMIFSESLQRNNRKSGQHNGIVWAIVQTYWFPMLMMAVLKLALSFLAYANPLILNLLIEFMSPESVDPEWRGYLYASLMFIAPMIECIITNQYDFGTGAVALRIKACLTNAIYKKVTLI